MKIQGLEETGRWEDLSESEQTVVTSVHASGIEGNIAGIKEILDVAKPMIVIGKTGNTAASTRSAHLL